MCENCKGGTCKGTCTMYLVAKILVIVGAVNWGLVGLGSFLGGANWNVVNLILGSISWLEAVVYLLVGIAGVVMIFGCKCSKCKNGCCAVEEKKPETPTMPQ